MAAAGSWSVTWTNVLRPQARSAHTHRGLRTTTSTDAGRCLTASLTAESAADQPAGTATYVVPFAPGEQYKLPGTAPDGTPLGLRPGLYTVKVGAPGYEYATVDVQVPLGASVTAPVAELLHAPTVQGTITSNADSSPTGPTCIYAIPDTSTSNPTACGTPTPSNCQLSPTTYNGTADANGTVCAYVDGSGQYRLQLPKHGTYTIRIVPSDPEFLTTEYLALRMQLWALAQVDDEFAEINSSAQARYREGLAALVREARPDLSRQECGKRAADIDVIQNGVWLTARVPGEYLSRLVG